MSELAKRSPSYHLKIIVCGSGAVGKTSIIHRYVHDRFEHNYLLTVGVEPSNRLLEINGKSGPKLVNLLIYDVAGQKQFQTLRDIFFRKAHAALLVFDLTRPETLEDLYDWKEQIDNRLGEDQIPLILCGNKSDLEDSIDIDYGKLEDEIIPDLSPIKYLETSALADINIRKAFKILTSEILRRKNIL
ncbi:MAG: Rab family GTPase [Candidatus Heimdallarchaeota archaeon]